MATLAIKIDASKHNTSTKNIADNKSSVRVAAIQNNRCAIHPGIVIKNSIFGGKDCKICLRNFGFSNLKKSNELYNGAIFVNDNKEPIRRTSKLERVLKNIHMRRKILFSLNKCRITDAGAIKLAKALPSSELTALRLDHNLIRDAGAIKLAEALPSSKLRHLSLLGNLITDAGAIKLAEAIPSSKLTSLHLNCNKIADTGAIKLMEALSSSKMKEIMIGNNQMTSAIKKRFRGIKNRDGEKITVLFGMFCTIIHGDSEWQQRHIAYISNMEGVEWHFDQKKFNPIQEN